MNLWIDQPLGKPSKHPTISERIVDTWYNLCRTVHVHRGLPLLVLPWPREMIPASKWDYCDEKESSGIAGPEEPPWDTNKRKLPQITCEKSWVRTNLALSRNEPCRRPLRSWQGISTRGHLRGNALSAWQGSRSPGWKAHRREHDAGKRRGNKRMQHGKFQMMGWWPLCFKPWQGQSQHSLETALRTLSSPCFISGEAWRLWQCMAAVWELSQLNEKAFCDVRMSTWLECVN